MPTVLHRTVCEANIFFKFKIRKQSTSTPIFQLPDNMIPTTENLDKLKRWGLKHYRVNRQRVQEMMGTATITTEPDLEPRVEKLQIQLIKYKELHMVSKIFFI